MKSYLLKPGHLKTFSAPGKPFLSFDEFENVVQWYRDVYYAVDNVLGFLANIGTQYNIWTRRTQSLYHRHIFLDQLKQDVTIAFQIPNLEKNATFPIRVTLFDAEGLYFEHQQEVAVEVFSEGRFVLSSWRRVPEIRDFLMSECGK